MPLAALAFKTWSNSALNVLFRSAIAFLHAYALNLFHNHEEVGCEVSGRESTHVPSTYASKLEQTESTHTHLKSGISMKRLISTQILNKLA